MVWKNPKLLLGIFIKISYSLHFQTEHKFYEPVVINTKRQKQETRNIYLITYKGSINICLSGVNLHQKHQYEIEKRTIRERWITKVFEIGSFEKSKKYKLYQKNLISAFAKVFNFPKCFLESLWNVLLMKICILLTLWVEWVK